MQAKITDIRNERVWAMQKPWEFIVVDYVYRYECRVCKRKFHSMNTSEVVWCPTCNGSIKEISNA